MGIRKTIVAVLTAAMVLSMTACGNNDTFIANNDGAETNSNGSSTGKVFGIEDDVPDPPKQVSMWDVLPEIPVTDASAFTYKYDSELGGMVVTDYLRESPKVRIPDKLEGEPVVKVDFSGGWKEFTQLVMPDTVKKISFSSTIKSSLQHVNHPRDMEKVDFDGCKNLEAVYIAEGATSISGEAFRDCENLTSINLPNSVTTIGTMAFYGCTSLTSVTIPNSVTLIDTEAFRRCTSLTSVTIPDSVTEIGSSAFDATPWLNNKRKENRLVVVNNILIDGETCSGDVAIPKSVTEIGGGAFGGCKSLTSVTIPDSVTEIGGRAFWGCTSLSSITIPDSVILIGEDAFRNCTSLSSVTYKGKTYDYEHINDLCKAINSN